MRFQPDGLLVLALLNLNPLLWVDFARRVPAPPFYFHGLLGYSSFMLLSGVAL